ncbi:hypothetical protein ACFSTD_23915 [Novosphingobium colocasiae]
MTDAADPAMCANGCSAIDWKLALMNDTSAIAIPMNVTNSHKSSPRMTKTK